MTSRFNALMIMLEKNMISLNDFISMTQDVCKNDEKGLFLYAIQLFFNIPLTRDYHECTCTQLRTILYNLNILFTRGFIVYNLSQHKDAGYRLDKKASWFRNWNKFAVQNAARHMSELEMWDHRNPKYSVVLAWNVCAPIKKFSALLKETICRVLDIPLERVVFGSDENVTHPKMIRLSKKQREHMRKYRRTEPILNVYETEK